jgi:hypothetical protein
MSECRLVKAENKLFTGYSRYGKASGLHYAGARFYSADLGRFLPSFLD